MRGISLTSSSLSSINLGYPLKGKLAAVLQTSALGGPTLSTGKEGERRHQALFWRRCRGGKVKGTHTSVPGNSTFLAPLCVCSKLFPLDSAIATFGFLFTLVRHNGQQ